MKFINFLNKQKYFLIFLIFGLLIFTYPMLLSGFDLMPGDGTDVKTFGYLLEHSRLWLLRVHPHEELWSAPFYYPLSNTLALSDALIGIMPIYWLSRLFFDELGSIQAVFVIMCILNYSTFYYFLNSKACKMNFSPLASSIGAFIFAFGLMRYFRMSHLNYYCQFYTILTLIFIFQIDKDNSKLKNNLCFLFAVFSLTTQFYTNYTLAFYFCIVSAFVILISFCFKKSTDYIMAFIKHFYKYIFAYFVLFVILLIPIPVHYLDFGETRTIESIIWHSVNFFAWIRSQSILDNCLIKDIFDINNLYYLKHEISASSGIFTTFFALLGMYKMKNLKWIFYISCIFIFILSCNIGNFNIWSILYYVIPGSQGIRVVLRISFIALIFICIALAKYIDFYKNDFQKISSKIILIASVILISLEQIPYIKNNKTGWETYCWSKSAFQNQINQQVKSIPEGFKVLKFVYNIKGIENISDIQSRTYFKEYEIRSFMENLAMWTSLKTNTKTVNGITGVLRDSRNEVYKNMYTKEFNFDINNFESRKYLLGEQMLN